MLELNVRRFKLYESVKTCVDQFRINTQRFGGELKNQFLLRGSARWRRSTPCAETSITAPGARSYL